MSKINILEENEKDLLKEIEKFQSFFQGQINNLLEVEITTDYHINLKLKNNIPEKDLISVYDNLCIFFQITSPKYWGMHKIGIYSFQYSNLNKSIEIMLDFSNLFKNSVWKESIHYNTLLTLYYSFNLITTNKTLLIPVKS